MNKLHKILSRKVKEPQGGASPNLSLHKGKKKSGFTLVELIIVITILAILATIAFVSFQNFSKDARDANRISTLKNIETGIKILSLKDGKYPDPTSNVFSPGKGEKQGFVGSEIKKQIGLMGKTNDPLDGVEYIYVTNVENKKYKLGTYLEIENKYLLGSQLIPQIYAKNINYKNRYLYTLGDRIVPIYLEKENQGPIHLIEDFSWTEDDDREYLAYFTNSQDEVVSGSGLDLLTNVGIMQTSCVVGSKLIPSGKQLIAYKNPNVSYGESCTPVPVSCNEGSLYENGNKLHEEVKFYNTCNTIPGANCTATSHTSYTTYNISDILHNKSQIFTSSINLGKSSIQASCENGTLTYTDESITCNEGKVYDDEYKSCNENLCTGTQPDHTTLNGTQKYNTPWNYLQTAGTCTYICNAGYYRNNTECIPATAGHFVASNGQENQTACNDSNQYQDKTAQTSCESVKSGHYSTPEGDGAHTSQEICPIGTYCENGEKKTCPVGTNTNNQTGKTQESDCIVNVYTLSGTIANGNGANISICGTTAIADTDGKFTINTNHGTVCNNLNITRDNYTCFVTTNGPASLTKNENVAGSCTPISYSITYNPNGGTLESCTPTTYYTIESSEITPNCTTKSRKGYTFSGFNPSTIPAHSSGEKTITAQWSIDDYTITYNLDSGTNDTSNPVKYSVTTSTIALANATRTGYTFAGWYDANTGGNKVTSIPKGSTGNKTLYAKWTPTNYTLTYNLNSGTNGSNPTSYNIETADITLKDATKTGYTFVGWYDANTGGNKITTIAKGSTGNKTLYAQWTINSVIVTKVTHNSRDFIFPSFELLYGTPQTKTSNALAIANGTSKLTATFSLKTEDGKTIVLSNISESLTCNTGYYINGTNCTKSTEGYYVNTTKTGEIKCEAGNYCTGGVKNSCAAGTTSSAGASNASQCIELTGVNLCTSRGSIIYVNSSLKEIGRVNSEGGTIGGNPGSLNCSGNIVVCTGNTAGYILQACNLGATEVGAINENKNSYGIYYQFGYNYNYHNHGKYEYYSDWQSPGGTNAGSANNWGVTQEDNTTATWINSLPANQTKMKGPCPTGYHVPTYKEWNDVIEAGGFVGLLKLSNTLKLPVAGYRAWNDKTSSYYQGTMGYYWSSSPAGQGAFYLFMDSVPHISNNHRATGKSIRCFKDY